MRAFVSESFGDISSSLADAAPFGESLPPPLGADDRPQLNGLPWDVFERLCRALYTREPHVKQVESYGIPGQTQHGIDILASRDDGALEVGQCKAHEAMTPSKMKNASSKFLDNWDEIWSKRNIRKFVLFVSTDLSRTELQDQILIERRRFREKDVDYQVWHQGTLADKLRYHRDLVEQFLGNRGWADQLCGTQGKSSVVVDSLVVREIELLRARLSETRALELDSLKKEWTFGSRQDVRDWVESQLKSHEWTSLSVAVRAGVLRLGARATALQDSALSKKYLAEAKALSADESDTYLEGLIAFAEFGSPQALKTLESANDAPSIKLRAAILLEQHCFAEARETLAALTDRDAEFWRLSALLDLFRPDIDAALESIRKAEGLEPANEGIRHVGGIVRYYAALSPAALPKNTDYFLSPVAPEFLREDSESRELTVKATEIFEAICSSTQTPKMAAEALAWRIATLLNLPDRAGEARVLLRESLNADPKNLILVHWAATRLHDFDLSSSIRALELDVNEPEPRLGQILALCQIYVTRQRQNDAVLLLEQHRQLFENAGEIEYWVSWYAKVLAQANRPSDALAAVEKHGNVKELVHLRLRLLEMLGRDRRTLADEAFEDYQRTGTPESLLQACEIRAGLEDWKWVADHASELASEIQTQEAILLGATAAFRQGNWTQCLALLSSNELTTFALQELEVRTLLKLGETRTASARVQQMEQDFAGLSMLRLRALLYWKMQDYRSLAYIATQIREETQSLGDELIRLAHGLFLHDIELARSLWLSGTERGITDSTLLLAFELCFSLGLQKASTYKSIAERVFNRASSGGDPNIKMAPISDFKELLQQQKEHSKKLSEGYLDGAHIHIIAQMTNLPLAHPYHTWLNVHESHLPPPTHNPLFVRSGRRAQILKRPDKMNLCVDVTGLLLAQHFDFLRLVEMQFSPIYIPPALQECLTSMLSTLRTHQPEIHAANLNILKMCQRAQILELSGEEVLDIPDSTTVGQFRRLLVEARSSKLLERHPSAKSPTYVQSFEDLLGALGRLGATTNQKLVEAADMMNLHFDPNQPGGSLRKGEELITSPLDLRELERVSLLEVVTRVFKLAVLSVELSDIRRSVEERHQNEDAADWVCLLQQRISEGLKSGCYIQLPALASYEWKTPELMGLENFLKSRRGNEVLWIDDRGVNRSQITEHGASIVGSLELLSWLRDSRTLSSSEYFNLLNRIRASNILFFPLSSEELLHFLVEARIENGELLETAELSVIRRSVAASLHFSRRLQAPKGDDSGEWPILYHLHRELSSALVGCFKFQEPLSERYAYANWVLVNLVTNLGGIRTLAGADTGKDETGLREMDIALLLYQVFAQIPGFERTERSIRQQYLEWIWAALSPIEKRKSFSKVIAEHLAAHFTQTHDSMNFEDGETERTCRAIVKHHISELPDELQGQLTKLPDFIDKFDIRVQSVTTVGNANLESKEFAATLQRLSEESAPISILTVDGATVTLVQESAGEAIVISHDGERTVLDRGIVSLLTGGPESIQTFLHSHLDWYDCPFAEAEQSLRQCQSPLERVQQADLKRQGSPAWRYSELASQIGETSTSTRELTDPPPISRMLARYRLNQLEDRSSFSRRLAASALAFNSEPFELAFARLSCFPVPLPLGIVERFDLAQPTDRQNWASLLSAEPPSPLARLHLAYLLVGAQELSLRRKGFRLVREFLAPESTMLVDALVVTASWSFRRLSGEGRCSEELLLALAWAHSEELQRVFSSERVAPDSVTRIFQTTQSGLEGLHYRFQLKATTRMDASFPDLVDAERLVISGLCYALERATAVPRDIRDALRKSAFPFEGTFVPTPNLVEGGWGNNVLGSWLTLLQPSGYLRNVFSLPQSEVFQRDQIIRLAKSLTTQLVPVSRGSETWLRLLNKFLKGQSGEPDLGPLLESIIQDQNLAELFSGIDDIELCWELFVNLCELVGHCRKQTKKEFLTELLRNMRGELSFMCINESAPGALVTGLAELSLGCEDKPEAAAHDFSTTLSEFIDHLPDLSNRLRAILTVLAWRGELPLSKEVWRPLITSRLGGPYSAP